MSTPLREVDRVEITALVDNYTDWLMIDSSETVRRAVVPPGRTLLAEHGLSLLVTAFDGDERHSVVMDAAVTPVPFARNVVSLDVDLGRVEAIVLSHGHVDHFGGMVSLLSNVPRGTQVLLHPDAFSERRLNIQPKGIQVNLPRLMERDILEAGATVRAEREATLLCSDMISSLGEIERVTDFETGLPWAEVIVNGNWTPDPILDDQGIMVNVRGRGLVVISGCAHAGIVNTVLHARNASGVDAIYAVLGGFHLTGHMFEPIIPATINGLKALAPDFIVPMHCTGWKAISQFEKEMPGQFLLNTVGTTYVF